MRGALLGLVLLVGCRKAEPGPAPPQDSGPGAQDSGAGGQDSGPGAQDSGPGAQDSGPGAPDSGTAYLRYDGIKDYSEVPSDPAFSVSAAGLTVAAWMRPDALVLPRAEGADPNEQYAHWMGKGEFANAEWAFRFYSDAGPRTNRISFYVFQTATRLGCGSYFQDEVAAGEWIHVVGVADQATQQTSIYKNGELRHSDSYASLTLTAGTDPLRIGTRDFGSYFPGAVRDVRIWSRALTPDEVQSVYAGGAAAGPVARFPIDEGRGAVLHDVAAGRAGRVVSGTWQAPGVVVPSSAPGTSGGGC